MFGKWNITTNKVTSMVDNGKEGKKLIVWEHFLVVVVIVGWLAAAIVRSDERYSAFNLSAPANGIESNLL